MYWRFIFNEGEWERREEKKMQNKKKDYALLFEKIESIETVQQIINLGYTLNEYGTACFILKGEQDYLSNDIKNQSVIDYYNNVHNKQKVKPVKTEAKEEAYVVLFTKKELELLNKKITELVIIRGTIINRQDVESVQLMEIGQKIHDVMYDL